MNNFEAKMTTYYGQASYYFTFDLMSRISNAISKWNPSHDYTRIEMPNYFDTVTITLADGSEKKYHYHKLLYGPMKSMNGKDVFKMRTDTDAFWLSQWGIEYSPFRVVQKILKDNGLYLVDHTFSGKVPFVYIYKFLPPRDVIKTIPWHDYHNIPGLSDHDFTASKLTHQQIQTGCLKSYIQLQAKLADFLEVVKNTSFRIGIPIVPVIAPVIPVPSSVRSYRDVVTTNT